MHCSHQGELPAASTGAGSSLELLNPFQRSSESTTVLLDGLSQLYLYCRDVGRLRSVFRRSADEPRCRAERWDGVGLMNSQERQLGWEGALERERGTSVWGWPCWEQQTGCAPEKWWSALEQQLSGRISALQKLIQITNKGYLLCFGLLLLIVSPLVCVWKPGSGFFFFSSPSLFSPWSEKSSV